MSPKQKTRQNWMKQADAIFARLVRESGPCRKCGTSRMIQCAHVFSRSYKPIRCDFRNALPLCGACHVYFTHHPIEWEDWLRCELGDDEYENLRHLARNGPRVDWKQRLAELRELERAAA